MFSNMKQPITTLLPLLIVAVLSSVNLMCKATGGTKNKRIIVTENKNANRVDVTIDGKPFTAYIYPDVLKKPVLYPIQTADGDFITRGWPMDPRPGERVDHPHHVGMWFNYGDVNGHDFWNNSNEVEGHAGPFGTIKHKQVVRTASGNDKGELEVICEWQKPGGTIMLRENTTYVFTGNANQRAIERRTTLTAVNEDVYLKDNKEGVLGIRLARELEHPTNKPEIFTDASGNATTVAKMNNEGVTGKYISSEGKTGDDVWGTRGKWVNLTGTIQNRPLSVVMLDHPANVGFPTYWHARGYGLFAANPLGQSALSNGKETLNFILPKGKSTTFLHKVIIHSGGQLTSAEVNAAFESFAK